MPIETIRITSVFGPSIWGPVPVTCIFLDVRNGDVEIDTRSALQIVLRSLAQTDISNASMPPLAYPDHADWPEMFAWLALNLLRLAGAPIEYSAVQSNADASYSTIAVEAVSEKTGIMAANLAALILNNLHRPDEFSDDVVVPYFSRLCSRVSSDLPSIHSRAIVDAARRRCIPVTRSVSDSIIELGNGSYRRHLIGSVTSKTSHIGFHLSEDKLLTNRILRGAGIPAPDSSPVRDADHAVECATRMGYPVVLKPRQGADSDGVFVALGEERALRRALDSASALHVPFLVEPYIRGREYRATLVGGSVVALIERVPPLITGDGEQSVQDLIDGLNADPKRGDHTFDPLKRIVADAKTIGMLEEQGMDLDSVPSKGQTFVLKPTGHISAGGAAIDRTDEIHTDNADLLRQVTRLLDIDIAGIDFVIDGAISESMWEVGGAIIEVNAGPGYWIHEYPSEGTPRDIGTPIIDMLFPPGTPVRVPIIAITKSSISTELSHRIATDLMATGHEVGLAAGDGLFVNRTHLRFNDPAELWSARKILYHPAVEIAVIEVDPAEILERGLAFEYCDVAIITTDSAEPFPGSGPPEAVLCRLVGAEGTVVLAGESAQSETLVAESQGRVVRLGGPSNDHADNEKSLYRLEASAALTEVCLAAIAAVLGE